MFAGPNGSGKSTVFHQIKSETDLNLGIYLNADDIEKDLNKSNYLKLNSYNLALNVGDKFNEFISSHSLFSKAKKQGFIIDLKFEKGLIKTSENNINSYTASILTDFLRLELIKSGQKLSFETVMSHESKIKTLKFSSENKYRNYLYYISTENADINKFRVKERVENGGHAVPEKKIEERYFRSLSLLKKAIPFTYRTFIFDNSGSKSKLILDIFKAKTITFHSSSIPNWVDKYCLKTP